MSKWLYRANNEKYTKFYLKCCKCSRGKTALENFEIKSNFFKDNLEKLLYSLLTNFHVSSVKTNQQSVCKF